ncbi:hypothetical protein PFICI_03378 [Pestalotiopsis fici W106-1]|uniref:Uncharacterized protein n=1 Tax=Pestalotiopsis fici (strain W106-1 / CGMCC3.15140) TaxID=1229662 RepID=W3XGZ0_PESFW|nr:uncharacterized protein PFICI_03378 [Pestalotiopsis fici W106-1]ETS85353.1 hypothetical protein PFICI_03378 [Pestalotiopsis fici W106-1]
MKFLACLAEDPRTKRLFPRNYLETLEHRVAFLEGLLKQYRPDLASDHLGEDATVNCQHPGLPSGPSSSVVEPEDLGAIRQFAPLQVSAVEERDGLDELASKVGVLSLNAAGAEPHYLGSSSMFVFSQMINPSLRQNILNSAYKADALAQYREGDLVAAPAPCPLPKPETAIRLSDAYFQNIHKQYPFLHEPTFRAWEAKYVGEYSPCNTIAATDRLPLFFLNVVCYNPI